jgi:hypothetical protein
MMNDLSYLEPTVRLRSGLIAFKIIVRIHFNYEFEVPEIDAFYRTYGVTADTPSNALRIIEEELEKELCEESVVEFTISPVEPCDIDLEIVDDCVLQEQGIHFVSGRIYFNREEEDEDV